MLAQIYNQGRRVFFYLTDEEVKFETAIDKFMVNAVAFGAELEREKAAQRAYDALERKAAKGYNAGGACFGYDNVPIYGKNANGEQVKSHTDYRINERQAQTIRAVFCAYADGYGYTAIAKALNGNGAEHDRPPRNSLEGGHQVEILHHDLARRAALLLALRQRATLPRLARTLPAASPFRESMVVPRSTVLSAVSTVESSHRCKSNWPRRQSAVQSSA